MFVSNIETSIQEEILMENNKLKMISNLFEGYEIRSIWNADVLDTQGILRLIESIPSNKAGPFKMWLAQMGKERITDSCRQYGSPINLSK